MTRDADSVCNVLLLKAADEKYARAFQAPLDGEQQQSGVTFNVHFVDVLTFEYVNAEALASALRQLENYSGILVTSPRGAIAISNAVAALTDTQARDTTLQKLRVAPIYSVGKATSRELDGLGVTCAGEESGSAEMLSEYLHRDGVLSEESKTKPMLFVCGEKRSNTLPESFRQRRLPIEELIVYKTCAVEQIELPEKCTSPDWVAFFSPSGLNAMKKLDLPWASVKKAAIGKTTATALQRYAEETGLKHWKVIVTAAKPTPKELAAAIMECELANEAT
uniref:Uroporphyrinogen-III synthase n=1 Tax=Globisporangium ultimum (strain ATCC 200006 / CBS 805.95 / DAOM BR144) TaxID=431595 RepID=K3X0Z9_GLOUD